jgi:CRP-like cAMP-binding protein
MQIPALGVGLIEGLSFKGKCYSALVQMLGTRSVTDRLAHLLLHLVDAYGIKVPDGTLIGAAFTHADLAHMVGATRQWVTISLQRLQEQGVVACRKSQIIVRRLDALSEMRGGG